jgi:UDP-arabinose 4-epimerase
MRVLVTGGAGYIGSHTAKALAQAGHEPVTFDDLSEGHRWAVRWGPLIEGGLSNASLLRETLERHSIEAVIHFAASAYVGVSMRDPRHYFANNVVNTLGLLNAMQDVGVDTIVFSSSCATYGEPQSVPIVESHPQRPVNPYGESKLFAEKALKWYGRAYGLRWTALRYFNAAGADPDHETGEVHDPETHLIPLVLEAADGRRPHVDIYGTDYPTPDGTAIRDYIHVSDLARAHVLALEYLDSGSDSTAVNLGTGSGFSVREVVEAAERVTKRRVPVRLSGRREGDPPSLVADASLAQDLLGWRPELSDLDVIVSTAWEWTSRDRMDVGE